MKSERGRVVSMELNRKMNREKLYDLKVYSGRSQDIFLLARFEKHQRGLLWFT